MRVHLASFLFITYGVGVFSADVKSLFVSLTAPSSTSSVDGLAIITTVKNTGNQALKLVNDPRTVLSTAQTKTFIITKDDDKPEFTGMIAKYSPQHALKNNVPEHFTILAPGESCQRTHSLSGVYNFTRAGPGQFKIDAYNRFHHVDESGQLELITAETQPTTFVLDGRLASARKTHQKRLRPIKRQGISQIGCNAAQASVVLDAAKVAETYLAEVNTYMGGLAMGSPRYNSWFGSWDAQRAAIVANHFANMAGDAPLATYNCAPADCTPDVFAYVFANEPLNINLCGAFWESPLTGTDSQGGTIIHELSHFTVNGGTDDYRYGPEKCLVLAQTDPSTAVMNADSHQYFAENNPAQQ
ncbi:unnamed protein product [Rhizoctonia solani]|uniref:Lysine-specific metallo-endopeptidase domain-containing protein n=1 Tax=Rhizoctonia solani TaxID=456999 RepID=A0A8H3BYG3_9AGAM|nr:unnamed protein product [Rhizoctonia solani]